MARPLTSASESAQVNQLLENARFHSTTNPGQAIDFYEKALSIAREKKLMVMLPEILSGLGRIHFERKNYKQTVALFNEAVSICETNQLNEPARQCYYNLAEIYFKLGNYELALECRLKILSLAKSSANTIETGLAYNQLGDLYKHLTEYNKAIEQHLHALKIFEELGSKRHLSITNFFIGNCFNWVNELETAQGYLQKSLQYADDLGDLQLKANPMGSMAILLTKQKKYPEALDYFHKAIDAVNIFDNKFLKADLLKSLGKLYIELSQLDRAVETLQQALQIAEELRVVFPTNIIHLFLCDAFAALGNFEMALNHHRKYMGLCRELNNEEMGLKMIGLQLKYDLDEIRNEKEVALRSNKLKDRFLSNISHELRTPLNGITGMVNLLADSRLSPEQSEYVNTIRLSANNLLVLINDLFDYTKINDGSIRFSADQFKIKELLASVIQMMRVKADEKNLNLSLSYDEAIPDLLVGDSLRLNQVLMNLLNNAIKYTEQGHVTLEVKILSEKNDEVRLQFIVSDTGKGIPEEKLPGIFESFKNPPPVPGPAEGSGLGLSIVKNLVELQQGRIMVSSRLHEGTVFKVELPFRIVEKRSRTKSTERRKSSFTPRDLSSVRILLVEDNKVNQFLGKQLLAKMGLKTEVAGNAKAALELLGLNDFDLILMDVQMPGMSGYELCTHIRKNLQPPMNRIPVIALTAYASAHEKENAIQAGMNDYLTKPYSPDELLSIIVKNLPRQKDDPVETADGDKVIAELHRLMSGNREDLKNLLSIFLEQVPDINQKLKAAIKNKQWTEAYQAAHKLKSSIKLLNHPRLGELITQLESNLGEQSDLENVKTLFDEYRKLYEKTEKQLEKELRDLNENP